MNLFGLLTSRNEKIFVLQNIIKKLNISEEEKELYILSIELLDENDFTLFFNNIQGQLQTKTSTIAPFSTQLI